MFEGNFRIDGHLIQVYAKGEYEIWSNCTELISTGLFFNDVPKHISDSYYCEFRLHNNLRYRDVSNVGIDMFETTSDKEIKVLVRNHSYGGRVKLHNGDLIGYLLFKKKEIL